MANVINPPAPDTDIDTSEDISLGTRIQALPQELQDLVISFTDVFHIPIKVTINQFDADRRKEVASWRKRSYSARYQPPVALQLNRKLRAKFAQDYYSNVMFECLTESFNDTIGPCSRRIAQTGLDHLAFWFASLEDKHKSMIRHFQIFAEERRSYHGSNIVSFGSTMMQVLHWCIEGPLTQMELVLRCNADDVAHRELLYDTKGKRLFR